MFFFPLVRYTNYHSFVLQYFIKSVNIFRLRKGFRLAEYQISWPLTQMLSRPLASLSYALLSVLLSLILWFSTWGEKFWISYLFPWESFSYDRREWKSMFSNSFVPLSFSHFPSCIHCCLGTLSSSFLIVQNTSFPQYLPQTLDPSRSSAQARILYIMLPTLLREQG